MEELAIQLENILQSLQFEIRDFYRRSYLYIKDLITEKKINLRRSLSLESEEKIHENIETMIDSIKLAFMTIGFSKSRLTGDIIKLKQNISKKRNKLYPDYHSYFEDNLKKYIDKILLQVLLEYLTDIDNSKIRNMDLFDLLPRNFINRLETFKLENITSDKIKNLIKEQSFKIENQFIPSEFEAKEYEAKQKEELTKKPETQVKLKDFVKELDSKSWIKTPIKLESSSMIKAPFSVVEKLKIYEPPIFQAEEYISHEALAQKEKIFLSETSLDYFKHFSPINSDMVSKFNIDINNLLNFKEIKPEFFNLENLFYYIAILKMLNLDFPFNKSEIITIIKKFILNGKIFIFSKDAKPDPISNFYGMSILSSLNILYEKDIIDVKDIVLHLETELNDFLPEKLHLNFYTILGLKMLEKNGGLITIKEHLINQILSLDITSLEEYNPILDIFEHLAITKLLDREAKLSYFKAFYLIETKKKIGQNKNIELTITTASRILLILDLLELKRVEFNTCQRLLKYITSVTKFFDIENLKNYFNWMSDKSGFTVELRMLFWALLASSQYFLITF